VDIIKHSSNIGTVKIAEKLDSEAFYNYILKFGFNAKTGVDLPGESPGKVRSFKKWKEIDKANVSFGQGVSTTSIQLVTAFSSLVNGGTLFKPYIVDKIIDNRRNTLIEFKPKPIRENILKPKTLKAMKKIMLAPMTKEGTGKTAIIKGLKIGGKTGTAQKFNYSAFRYYKTRYISSFIGAFPLDKPKYVIFIKVDDPIKNKYATLSAAPAFKQLALYLMDKMNHGKISIAKVKSKAIGNRKNKVSFKPDKPIQLITKIKDDRELLKLPDLKNMSLRQALRIFEKLNMDYHISGYGRVIEQSPKAGSYISRKSTLTIKLDK